MGRSRLMEYDKPKTHEIEGKPIPKENWYHSRLYKEVPHKSLEDVYMCWHCQENPRIKGDPDVLIWCNRCYILHFRKDNGKFIEHTTLPTFKKLLDDAKAGKIQPKHFHIEQPNYKIVNED